MIREAIASLFASRDLTQEEAEGAIRDIIEGVATDAQIGALLAALRMKGETSGEIAAFARVLRDRAVRLTTRVRGTLVDTCGTGGDGSGTFNISTAAAFVTAAAGVPVVKHGNRGVSSTCGSADVLEALGINIHLPPERAIRLLERHSIAFLFAPLYHPAMKRLSGPRRELGARTVFNLLGPLLNPANAQAQLVGVYEPGLVSTLGEVLMELGIGRALVVHGDGMDEISTCGPTLVAEVEGSLMKTFQILPEEFGLKRCTPHALLGGDARANASILMEVLGGVHGPCRDIVILNAGAAIYLGCAAEDIGAGIMLAEEAIDTGRAEELLRTLVRETNDGGSA